VLIFLTASSKAEWLQRLRDRRSESDAEMNLRVETAQKEYAQLAIFDYIVVNPSGSLDDALDVIESIITAEHHRVHHRSVKL
jgi:guanylate kinase